MRKICPYVHKAGAFQRPPQSGEHPTRQELTIPRDPERAATGHAGSGLPFGGRCGRAFPYPCEDIGTPLLLRGIHRDPIEGRSEPPVFLGRKEAALVCFSAAAQRGEQVAGHADGDTVLLCERYDVLHVRRVVPCKGGIDTDGDPCLLQQTDAVDRRLIAACLAADPLIRIPGSAVKRDVHLFRRVSFQASHDALVDQRTVRVQRQHDPYFGKPGIYRRKIRTQKRFSAREQQIHRPGIHRLSAKRQPFIGSELPPHSGFLLRRHTDVTHLAGQIAARRQLKRAADGDMVLCPFLEYILLDVHIFPFRRADFLFGKSALYGSVTLRGR